MGAKQRHNKQTTEERVNTWFVKAVQLSHIPSVAEMSVK